VTEPTYFTCPRCGGVEFALVYRRPLTERDIADVEAANPETAGMLRRQQSLNDSNVYAACTGDECTFVTSMTNVEIELCQTVATDQAQ
jgi:hypothetical protein